MQVDEEHIGRGRLLHARHGRPAPVPRWVSAVNALFVAWLWPTFRTARLEPAVLPEPSGRPRLFYGWHSQSWLAHVVLAGLRPTDRPAAIAHNR